MDRTSSLTVFRLRFALRFLRTALGTCVALLIGVTVLGSVGFIAARGERGEHELTLDLLDGEQWWAGVISQADQMPIGIGREYRFDFYGNTAGNQGQPLLISSAGRYVWSEAPFSFHFDGERLSALSRLAPLHLGQAGNSLKDAYRYASQHFFPSSGRIPDPLLFSRPQFNTWIELTYNQNQHDVLEYARKSAAEGFPPGALMIDEGWANDYGDWTFDRARFEDPKKMIRDLHDLGFKVMLWVCPYITSDGPLYSALQRQSNQEGKYVWIINPKEPQLPAIMHWWDGFSAMVDLTSPPGKKWLKGQLDLLVSDYGVDGFKFDGGDAVHYSAERMLTPFESYRPDITPNEHSEEFARLGLDFPLNEYRACWKMGGQPLAQRLRDKRHNWDDLRKLIPGIIDQGLMGYPFSCPDMIGGGEYLSFIDLKQVDQELIVRAAECHALMPMMQFSVAPWRVLSPQKLQYCLEMARLHTKMGNEILALARESARTGEPIVRSLEYEFPHQGFVGINDQFLLGRTVLVAPVLEQGARTRRIVFPPGTWKGEDGSVVEGPRTLEVDAPLGRLPWYRKITLSGRFSGGRGSRGRATSRPGYRPPRTAAGSLRDR